MSQHESARSTPAMMTLEQFADEIQLSTKTVLRLIASGAIAATKIGWQWRIPRTELERLLTGDYVDLADERAVFTLADEQPYRSARRGRR